MKRIISILLVLLPLLVSAQTPSSVNADCGDVYVLTAEPQTGFHFVRWSDDLGEIPSIPAQREVTATEDIIYTAIFEPDCQSVSGTCGENLTWELDCAGVLTISGTGAMGTWQFSDQVPWVSHMAEITAVSLPDGLTNIGVGCFNGCSNLTSIVIPNSVTSIGHQAFKDCSHLASITMSSSVTEIGEYAFKNCALLPSIDLPEGITGIGKQTFYGCSSLSSIVIPSSTTSIGELAFSGCTSLTKVTNGHNVASIGKQAFSDCSSLTSLTLPNHLTSIGEQAFLNCSSMTSVEMGNNVTSIGDKAFYKCSSLASISLSTAITAIGYATFSDCSSLTSIDIPAGVTSIGESAFQRCSTLVAVTIPKDVISIGKYAFHSCTSMTSATFKCALPTFGSSPFGGNNTATLYVPCGSKGAYASAAMVAADRVVETILPEYSITSADEAQGTVTLIQEPSSCEDLTLAFQADAANGFHFVKWSDDATENPRTTTAIDGLTLAAIFEADNVPVVISDLESKNLSELPDDADITIEVGGELNINSPTMTIHTLVIESNGTQSGQVHNIANLNAVSEMYLDYRLNPTGDVASPDQWYAVAVPFTVNIHDGITYKGSTTPLVSGTDFMIYAYDSEKRAQTGKGWMPLTANDKLEPGQFYLMTIDDGSHNHWLFKKAEGTSLPTNASIAMTYYGNGGQNAGINGIANPTLEYMQASVGSDVFICFYDNATGSYKDPIKLSEASFVVGQPFFIQIGSDASIAFGDLYSPAPRRAQMASSDPLIRLTLTNEANEASVGRMYISLHDDSQYGYVIGRDFARLDNKNTRPHVWCEAYDLALAAHGVQAPAKETVIPFFLSTPVTGTFRLAINAKAMEGYMVELLYNGEFVTNLSYDELYTLDLEKGTTNGYALRVRGKLPTDIGVVQVEENMSEKVLLNNQLYIRHGEHVYDAQGKKIK